MIIFKEGEEANSFYVLKKEKLKFMIVKILNI